MADPTLFEIHAETFSVNAGMYYCGRRIGTKDHVYGPEIRSHFLMVLVEKGCATLYREDGNISFGTHDMLAMFPGEKIYYEAQTDWSIKWVGVDGDCVEVLLASLGVTRKNPVFRPREYEAAARILDTLCDMGYDNSLLAQCRFQALLCQLFATLLSRTPPRAPDPVRSALEIIHRNYGNELNIKELADSLFLDSAYFSRLFKRQTGSSPKQYLLKIRMERARELLVTTDHPVKEIAATVGYHDALYFSRLFYQTEGVSPSKYRAASPVTPR